jgi:hypothetical protein
MEWRAKLGKASLIAEGKHSTRQTSEDDYSLYNFLTTLKSHFVLILYHNQLEPTIYSPK